MKIILVPVDFSAVTSQVIEQAAALAQATKGYLVLLHVIKVPPVSMALAVEQTNVAQFTRDIEGIAETELQRLKDGLVDRGVSVVTLRLTGEPKTDIIDQAKKLRADYIVMGSHGHSALYDLVIGSTASAVLKQTNAVLVVVPAAKKKNAPLLASSLMPPVETTAML